MFFDTIITSKTFGYWIWDNNLSDLVPFFSREYFGANFPAIINAFDKAGTFQSYIVVIRSALGSGTVVTFESPDPSHLIITVGAATAVNTWGALHDNEIVPCIPDQVNYPSSEFAFEVSQQQLTINETIKLIELLNVNGVFIETNFTT